MMVGAFCLMSAAAFAACQPAQFDAAENGTEPLKLEAQPAPTATAAKAAPKKAVAKAGAKTAAVSSAVASTDATPVANQQEDAPVAATIVGCLVLRDDGMFQLKDNDGEHAPKARSWKSGFIRKSPASVDVFDAGNRLKLGSHVGYRVSISGTLVDREMRARSLRATSEQCD
jgi:hypothetical protein